MESHFAADVLVIGFALHLAGFAIRNHLAPTPEDRWPIPGALLLSALWPVILACYLLDVTIGAWVRWRREARERPGVLRILFREILALRRDPARHTNWRIARTAIFAMAIGLSATVATLAGAPLRYTLPFNLLSVLLAAINWRIAVYQLRRLERGDE